MKNGPLCQGRTAAQFGIPTARHSQPSHTFCLLDLVLSATSSIQPKVTKNLMEEELLALEKQEIQQQKPAMSRCSLSPEG